MEFADHSDAPAPAAACAARRRDSLNRPFPLRRSRLFTAEVLRESERVVHLLLTVHHLIADAWSLKLVLRQVHEEYLRRTGATPAGRAPRAAPP
ncbi:condensation domain-containing protein [Streptomyces sp. SBR177]